MNTLINNKWSKPQLKNKDFQPTELLSTIIANKEKNKSKKRKPVNIVFVFDRSGSMSQNTNYKNNYVSPLGYGGNVSSINQIFGHNNNTNINNNEFGQYLGAIKRSTKLELVKQAALVAIANLDAEDIISVVSFGSDVKVLAKGVSGANKEFLRNTINNIHCDGMTALFDGWKTGAQCVVDNMKDGYINRILLLTDGQANEGLTDTDSICSYVRELAKTDITTSTFGVGNDYNEDLLQNMAIVGEGNYYYIQKEEQFEEMFSYEFSGLINLLCKKVSMSLNYEGWENLNLLNDFVKNEDGTYKLPNIVDDVALSLVFEGKPNSENAFIDIVINYIGENGETAKINSHVALDVVNTVSEEYTNQDVIDKAVIIKIANKKKEAIKALDGGNRLQAEASLNMARSFLSTASASVSEIQSGEILGLNASLQSGDSNVFRKSAAYQSYNATNSKIK